MKDLRIYEIQVNRFYRPKPFPRALIKVLEKDGEAITVLRLLPLPVIKLHWVLKEFNTGKGGAGAEGCLFIESVLQK